jgi:hypothetical protein
MGVKMKKLITGIMLVISVLFAVSCAIPAPQTAPSLPASSPANIMTVPAPTLLGPTNEPGSPVPMPITGRNNVYSVQSNIVSSKPVYMPGEQIQMELTLTNASYGQVEPVFVSPLPPAISLVTSGLTSSRDMPPDMGLIPGLASGPVVKFFPAGTDERKLAVGENINYKLTWDQKMESGAQAPSGWYFYEMKFSIRRESSPTVDSTTGGRTKAFLIQYPQGAMQKTIELNQIKTITGMPYITENGTRLVDLVINLKEVVLDEKGASFYAVVTSPGTQFSRKNQPQWASGSNMAQFIVDGAVNSARAANMQFSDNGVELHWGAWGNDPNYLDPVPADAKSLSFIITELFGQQGNWEFKILLE